MNINYKSKAFTMIEMLVSLSISLSVLFFMASFSKQQQLVQKKLADTTCIEWQIFGRQMDNYARSETLKRVEDQRITSIDCDHRVRCYVPYKDQILRRRGNRGYQPLLFHLKTIHFRKEGAFVVMKGTFDNGKTYEYYLVWSTKKD